MTEYQIQKNPKKRIAIIDICAIGLQKHHIASMIEIDVSASREKIKKYKRTPNKISFTAWLIKVISNTIKDHELVAAYSKGKSKIIIFNDINISLVVEKVLNGQKVPIPLTIEKSNERSIESITKQINDARDEILTDNVNNLQSESNNIERFYYLLPGIIRRYFWRYLLRHPHLSFKIMGNVAITSIGMIGNVNGWFIGKSTQTDPSRKINLPPFGLLKLPP